MSDHTTEKDVKPMNRFEQAARERAEHAESLRCAHLSSVPLDIAADVYALAWEDGHAQGRHEVEDAYVDLASVVDRAYRAGRDFIPPGKGADS